MITTVRFDNAVSKLYKAFHEGTLKGIDCSACAVGNICDNSILWYPCVNSARPQDGLTIYEDSQKPLKRKVVENSTIIQTGYSGNQLAKVESLFLKEIMFGETKETQFKGLCAVVEYLCELDNIPNVMDYTKLFETENEQPKYQLI